ncbi:MAG: YitT family protein [Anaerococcus sp.]|nr:YitT family protein [Anaerococcus sp.]
MKKYLWIFLGTFLLAIGLYFFLIQQDIAAGGVSGLSLVLATIFPKISVGVTNLSLNILVLILGIVVLGFDFAKRSLFASLSLSGCLIIFEKIFPNVILTHDKIINLVFGAIIMSLGLSIIFYQGGSTGGTDLIASILKKLTNLPMHVSLFIADITVVSLSVLVFGIELALYAALTIIIQSIGIDYFIQGFGRKIAIYIISDKYEEINQMLLKKYDKGVTLLQAEGGFSLKEKKVIMTVTAVRNYPIMEEEILKIDENAFIFNYQVSEVLGRGFTIDKN